MSFTFWLGISVAVGLMLGQYGLRHWLPRPYDFTQLNKIQTGDGWPLGLYYFPAIGQQEVDSPSRGAIVLCADVGEAPLLWSWGSSGGWVSALRKAGYDVWIACLRGTDLSSPTYLDPRYGWGWWAESHMQWDLPAIVDAVEAGNEGKPIHWLGRGFGGLLPLLAPMQTKRLASVAALGAGPGSRPHAIDRLLKRLVIWWPWAVFPVRQVYLTTMPLHLAWGWCKQLLKRRERTASQHTLAFLHQSIHGLKSTSTPMLSQWLQILDSGEWKAPTDGAVRDHLESPLQHLPHSDCPTWFVGEWQHQLPLPASTVHLPIPTFPGVGSKMLAPLLHDETRAALSHQYLDWLQQKQPETQAPA